VLEFLNYIDVLKLTGRDITMVRLNIKDRIAQVYQFTIVPIARE